jgi:hypothetical protein
MSIGEGDGIGELIISFVHETKTTDLLLEPDLSPAWGFRLTLYV